MSKKILVTGGAGFLGSNLCHKLLKEQGEAEVICLDNFYTGRQENIADLMDNPRFTLLIHDITEPMKEDIAVDEIYNLACPASPVHYQHDSIKTMKTSIFGMINCLEYHSK